MDKSAKYGYFSPDGKEYIVTRPDTPRPWINYLTNGKFTSLCSATGGGFSFYIDPGFNRITRGIPGELNLNDRPGRYLYVRDNDSGEYWSANWQPVMKTADFWEARIGLGYNKITSIYNKIQTEVTYFVPLEDNLEVWDVKVKNLSEKPRNITIFSYVEWVLGGFSKDLADRNFDSFFNDVYFKNNTIYATKRRWDNPVKRGITWPYWAYMGGSTKFDCYDCVKSDFIGEYRYLSNPIVVEKGFCQNGYGESEEAIGSLAKILELAPGEETSFHFVLGIEDSLEAVNKKLKVVTERSWVQENFKKLESFWSNYLDQLTVKTPSPEFNLSVNVWNKYQTWITAQMGEMISYFIGSGSWGFRDENQHLLGVLPIDANLAKEKLLELLEHQNKEGNAAHAWNPLTNEVYQTEHSDDTQWLVLSVCTFVRETGDLEFLNEKVKYLDEGEGTILEHTLKALDYTLYHVSPNGIPLRLTADWNDALAGGHLGRGESIMVACQVAANILDIIPILEKVNKKDKARVYLNIYEHLKKTINEQYWDGDWYVRATDDDGNMLGTKHNKEGKIHINSQTWTIMSSLASIDRGETAMNALWKNLMTEYGSLNLTPAYTKLNAGLGIVSQFAPGTKENAAIFYHPNAWLIIAECLLGDGEKAFDVWQRTSFLTRSKDPDLWLVEPYVYPEFSYGPESPHFGRGSYSWMTGSAAWFFRACIDYILGVRPALEGLKIDPCVPKEWANFEIKRNFRGATFNIKIKNPHQVNRGVKKLFMDGKEIAGQILPDVRKGSHEVEVEMGT